MKIAFITKVPNSVGRVKLREEAEKRGHSFTLLSWSNTSLRAGFASEIASSLAEYDVIHFAGGLGNFATREVQTVLEGQGKYCPNSYNRRSTDADNKVYQTIQFIKAGLPIVKSVRAVNKPDIEMLADELGWPMVAKEPQSTKGAGVQLLKSEGDFDSLKKKGEYLFQQYIDYESDYRVHVIGEKAFCPYRRIAGQGEFRANVSLGGSMERVADEEIKRQICDLAVLAAKAMNLEFCGADMIRDRQGKLYLLETNSDPGFLDVEVVTGESFAVPIIDHYEQKTS